MADLPNQPGKYEIEVWREVSATMVIEVLPEDCEEGVDLTEAALIALDNGGDPARVNWTTEATEVQAVRKAPTPTS